ncbi:hypothetical protein ACTXJ8_00355 [Corynebacterium variabile]|uniref:hypothetical protein n=1 Tax=Corynebacterium variabile TaxID=1727 RepID=UPI003FD30BA1
MAARDEWEPLDRWNVPVLLRGKVELVTDGQLSSGEGLRAADGQDHSGEGNNVKEADFLAAAAGIQLLERGLHEYNAAGLWDHYYGNTGELFVLSSAVADRWME